VLFFPKKKRKYFAACEYWVYLPQEVMPDQDALMKRMVGDNPHARGGASPITAKEGLLFSDIRLHLGMVLRAKNPHVFRPDLFHQPAEPTPEILEALASSKAIVKIRYVSEEPLPDSRHLQFLPHMADAVADLGQGLAVYDVVAERLFTCADFHELLQRNSDLTGFDNHVQTLWEKDLASGHAFTKGMIKKGLPELETDDSHLDQRVLVLEVLNEAAKSVWETGDLPKELDLDAFHDQFKIEITPAKTGPYRVRILRMMST
jgi:hypothetical protein